MSLVINHNSMAANTARNLNTHYGNLATSTQRLSSGLRINSAANDAAGLAIRELMRADIAAYNQGIRNANDAISMIQVVDGALGVIDEKLIRMKELAEQAATGTYDSTQRLMIDSEFQAMASEIQRIATATDFNGIKLIDGINDENTIIDSFDLNKPEVVSVNSRNLRVEKTFTGDWITYKHYDDYTSGEKTIEYISVDDEIYKKTTNDIENGTYYSVTSYDPQPHAYIVDDFKQDIPESDIKLSGICFTHAAFELYTEMSMNEKLEKCRNPISSHYVNDPGNANGDHQYNFDIDLDNDGIKDIAYSIGLPLYKDIDEVFNSVIVNSIYFRPMVIANAFPTDVTLDNSVLMEKVEMPSTESKITIHFGPMNDSTEDYYDIEKRDCTLKGLGLDHVSIETQDNAQKALVTINDAIVKKDKARAYYGAMQNRLENTVSNLTIQAENLQASESRISDVDVATEMTNFVRNQILTQSAVAMLSQANSMPQMAMQLIGG